MKKLAILIGIFHFLTYSGWTQIEVSGVPGVDGVYSSLTNSGGVFDVLNNFNFDGEQVVVSIVEDITWESGEIALLEGNWNALAIQPVGERIVSGELIGALISLEGADRVTLDGINDGLNSLEVINTYPEWNADAAAIRLVNDASYNMIRNCLIKSSSNGIYIGSGLITGNDYNQIEYCVIKSVAGGYLRTGISVISIGEALNDYGRIRYCQISDFGVGGTMAAGINLANGKSWEISHNQVHYTLGQMDGITWFGIAAAGTALIGTEVANNYCGFDEALDPAIFSVNHKLKGIYVAPSYDDSLRVIVRNNTIENFNVMGEDNYFVGIDFVANFNAGAEIYGNEIKNIHSTVLADVFGIRLTQNVDDVQEEPKDSIFIYQNEIRNIELVSCFGFRGVSVEDCYWVEIRDNAILDVHISETTYNGYAQGILSTGEIYNISISGNEIGAFISEPGVGVDIAGISMDYGYSIIDRIEVSGNHIHDFVGSVSSIVVGIDFDHYISYCYDCDFSILIQGNQVHGFHAGSTLLGINVDTNDFLGDCEIAHNSIYDFGSQNEIHNYTYGIVSGNPSNTTSIHNNLVAQFYNIGTGFFRVYGIYLKGGKTNVQYNTIYFDATVSNDELSSDCLVMDWYSQLSSIQNNILINKTKRPDINFPENAENRISCIARHSWTCVIGDIAQTASHNLFFVSPISDGIDRYIWSELIEVDCSDFPYTPLEFVDLNSLHESYPFWNQYSVEEDVVFESLDSEHDLYFHPNSGVPTAAESGASLIAEINDDLLSQPRFGNPSYNGLGFAPDLGCFEFEGIRDVVPMGGCVIESACNYSPIATYDNETCVFPENDYVSCSGQCFNDSDADGVCDELEIFGCTDPEACNYNSEASEADLSCVYVSAEYLNCDGSCVLDSDLDGVCDELEVLGCNDWQACNFNPSATENDGSCAYVLPLDLEGDFTIYSGELIQYYVSNIATSTFNWFVLGGQIISGQGSNAIVVEWPNSGPCQICVQETNSIGCVGEMVCYNVSILTSTTEQNRSEIQLYPNPVEDVLFVQLSEEFLGHSCVIVDATGRAIEKFQLHSSRQEIDVSQYAAGEYTLLVDGASTPLRWVKR